MKSKTEVIPETGIIVGQEEANTVKAKILALAQEASTLHARIGNTVLEIGGKFYNIKQALESVNAEVRHAHGLPTFSAWMTTEAEKLCNMGARTAWNYYRSYSEGITAGLSEKTIVALAPSLLKREKPRKAVFSALRRHPEIAEMLNSATPKQIKQIAARDEVKAILTRLKPKPTDDGVEKRPEVAAQISKLIVSAFKGTFKPGHVEQEAANRALHDITYGIRDAASSLGITAFLAVAFISLTDADVRALNDKAVKEEKPETQTMVAEQLQKAASVLAKAA
jgi:hypothetical protein